MIHFSFLFDIQGSSIIRDVQKIVRLFFFSRKQSKMKNVRDNKVVFLIGLITKNSKHLLGDIF